MSTRPVYLAIFAQSPRMRNHFAIFVANEEFAHKDPNDRSSSCRGTLIQVTGTPSDGFKHDFVRNFGTNDSMTLAKLVKLGPVATEHIPVPPSEEKRRETIARGNLDRVALQVPAPGVSEHFLAPVDGVSTTLETTDKRL